MNVRPARPEDPVAAIAEACGLTVGTGEVLVAEQGRVLGFVAFEVVAGEAHLYDVGVLPEARRQGVGRALVAAVAARARPVLLEVRRGNEAARGLYEAIGFAEVGCRRRYYGDDEDAVLYTLA